jgi:hypothetical protein
MLLLMPLLLYLTFVMPFRICFANDPVIGSGAYWFEFSIEVVKKNTHTHTHTQRNLLLVSLLISLTFIRVYT